MVWFCPYIALVKIYVYFPSIFIPRGEKLHWSSSGEHGAHSHALLTLLYIMALSWIEHEMVSYDSASRASCSTALSLHMERWLKAVLTHTVAGVHHHLATVDIKSLRNCIKEFLSNFPDYFIKTFVIFTCGASVHCHVPQWQFVQLSSELESCLLRNKPFESVRIFQHNLTSTSDFYFVLCKVLLYSQFFRTRQ